MKKLKYLIFVIPLFLVACMTPPTPVIEEGLLGSADPNAPRPLRNEATGAYFRTVLPFQASPIRGLTQQSSATRNRADIEQVEMSLIRLAADVFDPEEHFLRDGRQLTRDFASGILQLYNPDIEDHPGLNPPLGSFHDFGGTESFESTSGNPVRPLAHVLEQNFVTIDEDGDFQLEGVAIAISLNPFYWRRDPSIGFEHEYRMSDDEMIAVGQDIVARLLPRLRSDESLGLENVPILFGLFILQSEREVIPGGFVSTAFVEEGQFSVNSDSWQSVTERFIRFPDRNNEIMAMTGDVQVNDVFNYFRNSIDNHFPHLNSLVAHAHIVDSYVYRITMYFNASFSGASEKLAFHQFLEEQVMLFPEEHDIRITIRNPQTIHGIITRPPGGEAFVHRNSW